MKAILLLALMLFASNARAEKSYVTCKSSKLGAAMAAANLNNDLDKGAGVLSRDDDNRTGVTHLPKSALTLSQPSATYIPKDSASPDRDSFVVCVTVTGDFWDERN